MAATLARYFTIKSKSDSSSSNADQSSTELNPLHQASSVREQTTPPAPSPTFTTVKEKEKAVDHVTTEGGCGEDGPDEVMNYEDFVQSLRTDIPSNSDGKVSTSNIHQKLSLSNDTSSEANNAFLDDTQQNSGNLNLSESVIRADNSPKDKCDDENRKPANKGSLRNYFNIKGKSRSPDIQTDVQTEPNKPTQDSVMAADSQPNVTAAESGEVKLANAAPDKKTKSAKAKKRAHKSVDGTQRTPDPPLTIEVSDTLPSNQAELVNSKAEDDVAKQAKKRTKRKQKEKNRQSLKAGIDCDNIPVKTPNHEGTEAKLETTASADTRRTLKGQQESISRSNNDGAEKQIIEGELVDRLSDQILAVAEDKQAAAPVMSSPDDDIIMVSQGPASASSSATSSPVSSRVKKRQKRTTPSTRKKRKITQSEADDDIIMVAEVNSPSTSQREEGTSRLPFMSSGTDHDNLRRTTVKPLTQAQLFPRIPHITQLPQEEEDCCRLTLRPRTYRPLVPLSERLDLNLQQEPADTKGKHKAASAAKIKRELSRLIALLPQYPVSDVYEALKAVNTKETSDQLWTIKYQPRSCDHLLMCKDSIELITDWLMTWKSDITRGTTASRSNHRKKKKRCNHGNDSDSDGEEYYDEASPRTPLLVISGDPGLGKTTCAYTMASEQGYKVFEINPSMLRTTKTIMERIHESTQSQQVVKGKGISVDQMFDNMDKEAQKKSRSDTMKSFFSNVKNKQKSTEQSTQQTEEGSKSKKKRKSDSSAPEEKKGDDSTEPSEEDKIRLSKLSLILFDEADIVFEDDKGFHETIRTLGQQAKKPVILTCQTMGYLKSIGVEYTQIHLTQHSVSEVAAYLCLICLAEHEVADYVAMLDLVSKFNCDIRRCVQHLQYLVSSGGLVKSNSRRNKTTDKTVSATSDVAIGDLARSYRHQTSLDMISTHHQSKINARRIQKYQTLSSNRMCLYEDQVIQTTTQSGPVLWSSVKDIKPLYSGMIRDRYSTPSDLKYEPKYTKPEVSELMMSLRGAFAGPRTDISDECLSLDYLSFVIRVCQAEVLRRESKTSRRFLHYMDKIGVYMNYEEKEELITKFSVPALQGDNSASTQ